MFDLDLENLGSIIRSKVAFIRLYDGLLLSSELISPNNNNRGGNHEQGSQLSSGGHGRGHDGHHKFEKKVHEQQRLE
jgi:hypothetical protein